MNKRTIMTLGLASLIALLGSIAFLQVRHVSAGPTGGGGYEVSWYTVDGSGGMMFSTGGAYSLGGMIGQSDAWPTLSSGNYALTGGFWTAAIPPYSVYLPLIRK